MFLLVIRVVLLPTQHLCFDMQKFYWAYAASPIHILYGRRFVHPSFVGWLSHPAIIVEMPNTQTRCPRHSRLYINRWVHSPKVNKVVFAGVFTRRMPSFLLATLSRVHTAFYSLPTQNF